MTGTDRVSLTESIDDFDEAVLFYRCVLGLDATEAIELAAPFGLIRSRAATDATGTVRITLNAAQLRRGDCPAIPSPQHVAFTTDDAIASAQAMRALGAPVLKIPDNYYDDLDARVELPPERLAAMREHSILYDRDEHGEYLHFFTEMLGSRVFFEVAQRVGEYTGVGDPNSAPVRMAAHRERRLITLRDVPPRRITGTTTRWPTPDRPEPVATRAGGRRRRRRLPVRRPAPDPVTPHEPHYPLATDPALMRTTKVHLAATGIEVLDIELARIHRRPTYRDFERFLAAGAELGANVITQLPDPDRARKTDRFAQLCELARPWG